MGQPGEHGRGQPSQSRSETASEWMPTGGSDFGEGDVGVGEAGEVDLAGGADEGLDVVVDVPDVDVHAGHDAAAGEPEGDELEPFAVAPVGDLVVAAGRGQARALHAELVLVAVEVGHLVEYDRLAEHRPGGGRAAVQRIGPVLDADPPA